MHEHFTPALPVVVSIAGSDCSGGAGIQADIKTCAASGVFCPTAITAVTAQNPTAVTRVEYVGDRMLASQLESIFDSIHPDAVKIGMIPCASAACVIAEAIRKYELKNIVIDPVLEATAGGSLSGETYSTTKAVTENLFPEAFLVTPNIPELFRLLGQEEKTETEECARLLMEKFSVRNLLVKGGHAEGGYCIDTLYSEEVKKVTYKSERILTTHTHGTGCTLSSAIACGLAKGNDLRTAIEEAKRLIVNAIKKGAEYPVYPDNGPLLY